MIVTIWRHGQAGRAPSDRLRELTGTGTDDVGFGCRQFHDACHARELPSPELVLHSPWIRTTQTADIVASAFTHAGMRALETLQPGSSVGVVELALADLMAAQPDLLHAVLVSHQPLVSCLVDHLLGEFAGQFGQMVEAVDVGSHARRRQSQFGLCPAGHRSQPVRPQDRSVDPQHQGHCRRADMGAGRFLRASGDPACCDNWRSGAWPCGIPQP